MDFDRFLDRLKSERQMVDTEELQLLLTHREQFDEYHDTSVIIGRLPSNINDIADVEDCYFDESLDDWCSVLRFRREDR